MDLCCFLEIKGEIEAERRIAPRIGVCAFGKEVKWELIFIDFDEISPAFRFACSSPDQSFPVCVIAL